MTHQPQRISADIQIAYASPSYPQRSRWSLTTHAGGFRKPRLPTWPLALALLVVACDADRDVASGPYRAAAFGSSIGYYVPSGDELRLLDLSGNNLKASTSRVHVVDGVEQVVARRGDHAELLVLTSPPQGGDHDASGSTFSRVDEAGGVVSLSVSSTFGKLVQSDDGRFVVRYGVVESDSLLTNRSEIEVIDLDAKDGGKRHIRGLPTLGDEPSQLHFLPEFTVGGEKVRILLAVADEALAMVDLTHPDRNEVTVDLRAWHSLGGQALGVVTDVEAKRLYFYLNGFSDLLVVDLIERAESENENPFRPVLSTLATPSGLEEVVLYQLDGKARLLCATAAGVAVIDPERGTATVRRFGEAAVRVHSYQLDESSGEVFGLFSSARSVGLVDLRGMEPGGVPAELVMLISGKQVDAVTVNAAEGFAVATLGGEGLSVVDLVRKTATPFATQVGITHLVLDAERRGMWVGASTSNRVAFFDFVAQTSVDVRLDAPVDALIPLFAEGRMVVLHDDAAGYVTVLDADDPKQSSALALQGFLVSGLAD